MLYPVDMKFVICPTCNRQYWIPKIWAVERFCSKECQESRLLEDKNEEEAR